jgi:palmitoyl transferase
MQMAFTLSKFLRWRWRRVVAGAALTASLATPVRSGPVDELGGMFKDKLGYVSTAIRAGQTDIYLTGYCWHLPYAYSDATRARLNETTWGGGIGRSMTDEDGDRHSVFFVGFEDSHRSPQFILSYGWQRYFTPERPRSFGWGYMAFLFAREDVQGYSPVPGLLPCLSYRSRRWEVIGVYVPRISEDIKGDVLFLFLRWSR